jgi:predicted  nucleic acid-binding Zn-ribbon protein
MNKFANIINLVKDVENDYSTLSIDLNKVSTDYNDIETQLNQLIKKYDTISNENQLLKKKIDTLTDEIACLKKVSIYTTLNKQLVEKDKYIEVLEKRLKLMNNKIDTPTKSPTKSPEIIEEPIEEPIEEVENDPEIEYETVKIGKKYYYISNEDPSFVYEVIKGTNEVGDKLGKYNKDLNKIEKE